MAAIFISNDPKKYGKQLAYSSRKYPEGTCPNAEELLKRSFLIPFNENYLHYSYI